jgi:hypothetical protein
VTSKALMLSGYFPFAEMSKSFKQVVFIRRSEYEKEAAG